MASALLPILQVHGERTPDIHARGELKIGGHYAYDGVEFLVHFQGLPQRVAAAGETALPEPIAQDGNGMGAEPGFLDHFDQVTFSYELGVIKPEAEIYHDAIRGLGVEPVEALFLDDRPENVEGGRAAGIHAELFTTWEEFLERDRMRYGLPEPQQ